MVDKYLVKNILRRIFFSKSNYLLMVVSYLLLAVILRDLLSKYLVSSENFRSLVVNPFVNTLNVVLAFNYIFSFSGFLQKSLDSDSMKKFKRLSIPESKFQISINIAAVIYICYLIIPSVLLFILVGGGDFGFLKLAIFPLLSSALLLYFIFSWLNIFSIIFKNTNLVALLTFLTIGLFSFMNSISSSVDNLFLANFLREASFISHLEPLYAGVLSFYDIFYLFAFPLFTSLILSIYVENGRSLNLKNKYLMKSFGIFGAILCAGVMTFMVSKKNITIDLSEKKIKSLSKESIQAISDIKKPITVKVFTRAKDLKFASSIMNIYQENNRSLNIEYFNPDLRPDLVKKYNVTKIPALVFSKENYNLTIFSFRENSITSAFIKLSGDEKELVTIYNEMSKNKDSLTVFKTKLQESYFDVKKVDSLDSLESLDQSKYLIYVVDYDFNNSMRKKISKSLENGMNIFLLLSPNFGERFKNIGEFLSSYGIRFNKHFAVDFEKNITGSKGTVPFLDSANLLNGNRYDKRIIFPLSSVFEIKNWSAQSEIKNIDYLATTTTTNSWGELNVNEVSSRIEFNEGDLKGPVGMAVGINFTNGANLAVIGSRNFLDDQYANVSSNIDYFLELITSTNDLQITQYVETNLSGVLKGQEKVSSIKYSLAVFVIPLFYFIAFLYVRRRYEK